jgi:hypothetical protein
MKNTIFYWTTAVAGLIAMTLLLASCDEGIDDWNSSAKVTGYVYTDPGHTRGVEGVQVILESDQNAPNPYQGPDRWVTSNRDGYFEKSVFLGNSNGQYVYVADLSVQYFWHGKSFAWNGGVTVGPGSVFTLPSVDTTMMVPITTGP